MTFFKKNVATSFPYINAHTFGHGKISGSLCGKILSDKRKAVWKLKTMSLRVRIFLVPSFSMSPKSLEVR